MIGDDSFDFFAPRKGMMSCRGVGCWTLPKTSTRSRRLLLLMLFEVQHLKTTAVKVEKSVLNAVGMGMCRDSCDPDRQEIRLGGPAGMPRVWPLESRICCASPLTKR